MDIKLPQGSISLQDFDLSCCKQLLLYLGLAFLLKFFLSYLYSTFKSRQLARVGREYRQKRDAKTFDFPKVDDATTQ